MQGGYQLLDFGNFGYTYDTIMKIPFNIRDYKGKQVRVKGIYFKDVDQPQFDSNSIFTMNVISTPIGIVLSTTYYNLEGEAQFLSIVQLNSTPDFHAQFIAYPI